MSFMLLNELLKLFEIDRILTILYPVKITQSTSSSSTNNIDFDQTSTSSSWVESVAESLYINETLEIIEIC